MPQASKEPQGPSEAELTELLDHGSALQGQRHSLPPFVVYGVQASAAGIAATLIIDVAKGMQNRNIRMKMLRCRMLLGAWMTGLYIGGTEYLPPPQALRDAFGWHPEASPYRSFKPDSDRIHPWFRSVAGMLGFSWGKSGSGDGCGGSENGAGSSGSSSMGS